MPKTKFNMNMDTELKKKLNHIAIDEEMTVTDIMNGLIEHYINLYNHIETDKEKVIDILGHLIDNFIETSEEEKDNLYKKRDAKIYKRLDRNGIEINEEGIILTDTFFSNHKIRDELADYFCERASGNSHNSFTIPLEK